MTPEQIEEAASRLFEAERTGTQCGLLSLAYPDMTLDDAYAVQAALVAKEACGRSRHHRLEDRPDQPRHAAGAQHHHP
jgi:2-oxo-hept-3-ene-1,7-dioate hydratase